MSRIKMVNPKKFGDYICDYAFAAHCRSNSRCQKFPSVPPRMERPAPDRDPGSGNPLPQTIPSVPPRTERSGDPGTRSLP